MNQKKQNIPDIQGKKSNSSKPFWSLDRLGFCSIGLLSLILIAQWALFPIYTPADRDIALNTPSAKDRADSIQKTTSEAADHQEFLNLVNQARNARNEAGVGEIANSNIEKIQPKPNQPKPVTTQPKPPVIGSQWGKESHPALRNFSKWADRYADASPAKRDGMVAEGLQLVQQRREIMTDLIQNNPQLAIASAMPVWRAGEIPLAIRDQVEKRISGIGDLSVLGVTSQEDNPVAPLITKARIGFEAYDAHVYGRLATVGSQKDISMHGVAIDDQAALMDSPIRLIDPGEPLPDKELATNTPHAINRMLANRNVEASQYAFAESGNKLYCLHCAGSGGWQSLMSKMQSQQNGGGGNVAAGPISRSWQTLGTDKKIAVAMIDFSDMTGGEVDTVTATSRINEVDNHLREVSYDQFGFGTKTVVPTVLRMPQTAAYYQAIPAGNTGADGPYKLAEDFKTVSIAAGYNPADYQFIVMVFKNMDSWQWAGLGTIGESPGEGSAITWINGTSLDSRVLAHEIGHNLGLYHANAWEQPTNATQPDAATGSLVPYGNYYDTMGDTWRKSLSELQFNSQFKSLLGWMPDENIQTVNGNFSGRIYASDQTKASDRKYALKIDANRTLGTGNDEMSNMDYWIEHRSRFTSDAVINNGAMIYLADEVGTRNHLALLDMTPNTETYRLQYSSQAHDQALQNGGSFTDSNNRWKIQITGKGGAGPDAYVDVQVTDLLSPQITSQPMADQNATAGGSVTFNVTASGTSLTYQWQKQDANGTWVNINGATAASFTLTGLSTANAGKYRVAITNTYGLFIVMRAF